MLPIMSFNVSDKDTGRLGDVFFSIVEGNDDGKFYLEQTTGGLNLIDALDFEEQTKDKANQRDSRGMNVGMGYQF